MQGAVHTSKFWLFFTAELCLQTVLVCTIVSLATEVFGYNLLLDFSAILLKCSVRRQFAVLLIYVQKFLHKVIVTPGAIATMPVLE